MSRPSPKKLAEECARWNARNPIGTRVTRYKLMYPKAEPDGIYTTRTAAEVLSGHTAVVWLDGFSGCVALDSLEVASPPTDWAGKPCPGCGVVVGESGQCEQGGCDFA